MSTQLDRAPVTFSLNIKQLNRLSRYYTVADPPDWDRLWDEERSILKEFES